MITLEANFIVYIPVTDEKKTGRQFVKQAPLFVNYILYSEFYQ